MTTVRSWDTGGPLQNFGDQLTGALLDNVFDYQPTHVPVVRLIGSVIDQATISTDVCNLTEPLQARLAYWGCGMRDERPIDPKWLKFCDFTSVRGPLTRRRLGQPSSAPMGDGALLTPLFHQAPARMSGSICLTHIGDAHGADEILAMTGADAVIGAGVEPGAAALRDLMDHILAADFVLTGALHGAVLRAAYGLPFAFWDSGAIDLPFKWRDFAASIGVPCAFAKTITEGRIMHRHLIKPSLRLPKLTSMLAVAPLLVRPEIVARAAEHDLARVADIA